MTERSEPDSQPDPQAQRHYMAYLLRLWSGSGSGANETRWQASLEVPLTHEKHNFASLQNLFAYLEAETETDKENSREG